MVIRVYHGHYTYSLSPGSQERKNSRASWLIYSFSTHPCKECGKELEKTGSPFIFHALLTTFHLQCRYRARHSFLCPRGSAAPKDWCTQRAGCDSATRFLQRQDEDSAVDSGSCQGTVLHAHSASDSSERLSRERSAASGLWVLALSCWELRCRHLEGLTAPRRSTWHRPPACMHQGGSHQGIRRWCGCENMWWNGQTQNLAARAGTLLGTRSKMGTWAVMPANTLKSALSSRI